MTESESEKSSSTKGKSDPRIIQYKMASEAAPKSEKSKKTDK